MSIKYLKQNAVPTLKHLLHGHIWDIDQDELRHALHRATRLAPRSLRKLGRPPMTIEDIKILRSHLSLDDPCDVAI